MNDYNSVLDLANKLVESMRLGAKETYCKAIVLDDVSTMIKHKASISDEEVKNIVQSRAFELKNYSISKSTHEINNMVFDSIENLRNTFSELNSKWQTKRANGSFIFWLML